MSNSVLFIADDVPDYQALLTNLAPDVKTYVLNSEQSGVLQMIEALKKTGGGLDAIHIVSHGSSGSLLLGTSVLNNDNLADYADALVEIGSALAIHGDILLYGCNVAEGNVGQHFIEQLSDLTRRDVAASTTLTGSALQGGDWQLEAAVGMIEAPSIQPGVQYEHVLKAPTATNLNKAESYTEDKVRNLFDIVVTDTDSANVTVTLTLSNAAAGKLLPATSGSVTSTYSAGVWQASGATADVNILLAGLRFKPTINFNGSFSVATSVSDGTSTITGTKNFTGIAVNDRPVALADTLKAVEDTAITYSKAQLLGNDKDVDGNSLSIATVTSGTGGTAVLNSGGFN